MFAVFRRVARFCRSILEQIKAIIARFRKKKPEPPPIKRTPGLPCPQCSTHIEISIPALLSGAPIVCPNCFLKLTVNQERSTESLTALNKLHTSFQKAQKMIDDSRLN